MDTICRLFGVSRQANSQHFKSRLNQHAKHDLVISRVLEIRHNHPRIGTRKIYYMLQPFLSEHSISLGRDALFNLLASNKLLIRTRIRKVNTTYSQHWMRKWPNLIRNYRVTAPNHLWVSDITYWRVAGSFVYISFITDAYSHKIVGYSLSETLDMSSTRLALLMALKSIDGRHPELIHHSDRGTQYCSMDYIKLLHQREIQVSMTENGDPKENAIAERLNGIIKEEYLRRYKPKNFQQATILLKRTVDLYNHERPHLSINLLTPDFTHYNQTKTYRKWKSYFKTKTVNVIQD